MTTTGQMRHFVRLLLKCLRIDEQSLTQTPRPLDKLWLLHLATDPATDLLSIRLDAVLMPPLMQYL